MTIAAQDVLAERHRQIEAEGWTPEHDDTHDDSALTRAAICYADVSGALTQEMHDALWPWSQAEWKPTNKRRDLIKAAALLLAEIERLDRASERGRDA